MFSKTKPEELEFFPQLLQGFFQLISFDSPAALKNLEAYGDSTDKASLRQETLRPLSLCIEFKPQKDKSNKSTLGR